MSFVISMWSIWGLTVLFLIGMLLYRSRLTRDEEDQLFLDDSFSTQKSEQAAITDKVSKIAPVVKGSKILALVTTLFVIGYYIHDVFNQFR